MWVRGSGFFVLLALAFPACADSGEDCNRDGCDALGSRAAMTGKSGVAGVVAEESDVVANGCQACPFASAPIAFWPADAMVSANEQPIATVDASSRYSVALDAGTYLACVRSDCVNVPVQADHVTTLNIHLLFGPTQFVIH